MYRGYQTKYMEEKMKKTKTPTKKLEEKKQPPKVDNVREIVNVDIEGNKLSGAFREFSSGSKGWYVNGKVTVDGVRCQVSCNIIVIGSKPTKEGK